MNEEELKLSAASYIKQNKAEIIKKFADPTVFSSVDLPISLFMAGSPGAGKTEFSKRLIEKFETKKPVRIDADEIREIIPGYNGSNSHIFQFASNLGVEKLYDYVLDKNISAIIDGTFSSEEKSINNIERSIRHNRKIEIYYLYQNPELAWKFTQIREAKEGRRIRIDNFIESFINSRNNVNKAKSLFGGKIELNMIVKDFDKNIEEIHANIENIDLFLPKPYTVDDLRGLIKV